VRSGGTNGAALCSSVVATDEDLQWLRCFMRKKKVAEKWSVKAGFVVYNDG
jgi:hypothetical protein